MRPGPVPNSLSCGEPEIAPSVTLTNRIVGGVEASAHSWPWVCSIRYKYLSPAWGQFCGASILTSRHVVTAAHCLLVTLFIPPELLLVLTNNVQMGTIISSCIIQWPAYYPATELQHSIAKTSPTYVEMHWLFSLARLVRDSPIIIILLLLLLFLCPKV